MAKATVMERIEEVEKRIAWLVGREEERERSRKDGMRLLMAMAGEEMKKRE